MANSLLDSILQALDQRERAGFSGMDAAYRVFNGFYESEFDMAVDRYGSTLVVFNYADPPDLLSQSIREIIGVLPGRLPGIDSVLVKTRAGDLESRRGVLAYGDHLTTAITENGVRYAIDLRLNQDASFYLDTRNLRVWLKGHSAGGSVLNCFAYTGSLGAAALAGGARQVQQLDLSQKFLNLAQKTYSLNGYPVKREDFLTGDFFQITSRLRRQGAQFDCVVLDAPFFSHNARGMVNIQQQPARLINKVRPLVKDGGRLVAINNSLFLSGADYLRSLEILGKDGCLEVEEIIEVPGDVAGFENPLVRVPPCDPSPFNHPTKIAILRIRKK